MSETHLVQADRLKSLCTEIQMAAGIGQADAQVVADCLVEANLMGLDTHGVIRLKVYLDRVREGGNNPAPTVRTVKDAPCTALLDADNALGPVGGKAGMDLAINKAATTGLAMVLVTNGNHYGPAGYYTRMATERNMIGLSLSNVLASMPPTGGAQAQIGNNPYSIAFPTGDEPAVVVDGATSKASWGKLFLCAQTEQNLPADCYLDAEGNVTVDPQAVLAGGCLLPIAGHKGYGLAAAIELLTGMLAGSVLDHDIPHPYKKLDTPGANTFTMMAIRPDAFGKIETFKRRMDEWARRLRNTRKAPGADRIYLPGEIEHITRQKRLAEGIPLNEAMWKELHTLASDASVDIDA